MSLDSITSVLTNYVTVADEYSSKLACFCVLIGGFTALYVFARLINKVSIVDPYWSLGTLQFINHPIDIIPAGFLASALVYRYHVDTSTGNQQRKDITLVLTATWAIRLAAYLFWRNWGHEGRYRLHLLQLT